MADTKAAERKSGKGNGRLKKSERRRQILLELKLQPHVRISELAAPWLDRRRRSRTLSRHA